MVISGFSVVFVLGSFAALGIEVRATPLVILQVCVTILVTSLFCFALVLPLVALSRNATTVIALANVLNVYALLSSGVFIPLDVMLEWSAGFIITSPFHHLNVGLRTSFVPAQGAGFWLINAVWSGDRLCVEPVPHHRSDVTRAGQNR